MTNDTTPRYLILMGNPGVGKSTLLNALLGEAIFKSGVSFGKGLTKVLQLHELEPGRWLGDTPGLDDAMARKKAAEEITKMLKKNGLYQLLFVVTEEGGRVRPADATTMKLILEALPEDKKVVYGIVVNKITVKRALTLAADKDARDCFLACLNQGRHNPTGYIHFYFKKEELEDEENKVHVIDPSFRRFLEELPPVEISEQDVSDVKSNEYEAVTERMEAELKTLRDDRDYTQKRLNEMKALSAALGAALLACAGALAKAATGS